ncbi:MAG: hypothetical protein GIW97_00100 [Candidatus Eremiobacteraeota bacterium]|nr:hypothetical protein [Candidatus Eremiobacteraeota bacterium]
MRDAIMITGASSRIGAAAAAGVYAVEAVAEFSGAEERDGMPAGKLAEVIAEALLAKKPQTRYVVGAGLP